MHQHTDQYYIDKILQGNTQAFAVLVEKYQSYIYTIVLRMVRVKEEAEEPVEAVDMEAVEVESKGKDEEEPAAEEKA